MKRRRSWIWTLVTLLIVYLIVFDLLCEAKSIRKGKGERSKRKKAKVKKVDRLRLPLFEKNVVDDEKEVIPHAEYDDVPGADPTDVNTGLRRAFLRFLKDSLRRLHNKQTDRDELKLAVGVPMGLVTAYGVYSDFCDDSRNTTRTPMGQKMCELPKVIVPKISEVTQRVLGRLNIFQSLRTLFSRRTGKPAPASPNSGATRITWM